MNNNNRYEEIKNLIPKSELTELLKTKTYKEIGKEFGCSERLISKLAKDYNISKNYRVIRKRKTITSSFNLNHILYLYLNEYMSCREIADIYNTTHGTISNYLKNNGIEIRPGYDINYYKNRRSCQPYSYKDDSGYVVVSIGRQKIREHRYVMEQFLGRELNCDEYVHHINFIRDDNRIDNLFLFSSNSKHKFYHCYIKSHQYISPQEFLDKYEKTIDEITSYQFLLNLYIYQNYSANAIAKYVKENKDITITRETVVKYLKKYGIYDMRKPNVN